MEIMTYYAVDVQHISGGRGQFVFLDKGAAERCIKVYGEWAEKVAEILNKRIPDDNEYGESVKLETGPDVYLAWNGPMGFLSFRATIRKPSTEDHVYPSKES